MRLDFATVTSGLTGPFLAVILVDPASPRRVANSFQTMKRSVDQTTARGGAVVRLGSGVQGWVAVRGPIMPGRITVQRLFWRTACCTLLGAVGSPVQAQVPSVTIPVPVTQENPAPPPLPPANGTAQAPNPYPAGTKFLSLGECIAIGLECQPNIRAARHSQCATEIGAAALYNLPPLYSRLAKDLPIRKCQASAGMTVAAADVQKTCQETIYDVTRLYYTTVYARQQELVTIDIIEQLEVYENIIKELIKSGVRDQKTKLSQFTLYAVQNGISEVKQLRIKAATGRKAALEALREAMGVEDDFEFAPKDDKLPLMAGSVSRGEVVQFAMSRRPELSMAAAGVDAFRLEVCAQDLVTIRPTVPTLGSGSDNHSRYVPGPVRNGEYKPGALSPEMPPVLVGRKEDRTARACALSQRQDVLLEKTEKLVRLEAVNAFLNWEASVARVEEAKRKYDNCKRMVEEARAAYAAQPNPELLVSNVALAGKAQADYLEAVFEHLKTLAALERITAGGVRADFPGR